MFEKQLVRSCSPTLAGLKSGNLFRYRCGRDASHEVSEWSKRLASAGISMTSLRRDEEYVLVYVYRPEMVSEDMDLPGVREFLDRRGYDCSDLQLSIDRLRERMVSEDFPHEVGLFLGYPLHDVLGFINNCGRDCRFCGCWKVYDNEHQTREQFARFKECSRSFMERFNSGIGVVQLVTGAT